MAFGQCRRPPVDPAPEDPGSRPCRSSAAMAVLGLQLPSEGPAVAGVLVVELRACNHMGQGLQEQAPGCTGCLQRDGGHRLQWQGPGVGQWVGELQWQSVGLQWLGRQRLRLQLPGLQWQSVGLQRGGAGSVYARSCRGSCRGCNGRAWACNGEGPAASTLAAAGAAMAELGACNGRPAPARPGRGPGGPKASYCRIWEAIN